MLKQNSSGEGHVSRNESISDTESFHSPLRSESPLRSDDPSPPSKALVKYIRPDSNPEPDTDPIIIYNHKTLKATEAGGVGERRYAESGGGGERRSREAGGGEGRYAETGGGGERRGREAGGGGGGGRRGYGVRREVGVKRAELGFRVCEAVLCLVAFSVMAADKTEGWSGDSFDRYKEYRYCVAVTVIGFAYSSFQASDLAYNLSTGKYVFSYHLRHQFVFAMDQILAYLLISASSAAATRVDNWVSNWGKDEFTVMATASIAMSFLAFGAFALSSLISGYNLCNRSTS